MTRVRLDSLFDNLLGDLIKKVDEESLSSDLVWEVEKSMRLGDPAWPLGVLRNTISDVIHGHR
jgi:hypothetical protein